MTAIVLGERTGSKTGINRRWSSFNVPPSNNLSAIYNNLSRKINPSTTCPNVYDVVQGRQEMRYGPKGGQRKLGVKVTNRKASHMIASFDLLAKQSKVANNSGINFLICRRGLRTGENDRAIDRE